MGRTRANSREWRQYYERAARVRELIGDPFVQARARARARERWMFGASALFMAAVAAAFLMLATG
ncbi:MAG TPA: hypothetical protein VHO06_10440 [Polyangia bacterium]|nr:hypothetical protein [Polyangia bacterium]